MKLVAASLILLAACGDDGPSSSITYTGGYEDWDSTDDSFLGIFEATVTEVGDPSNTTTTAPNGRSTLEIPGGGTQVTWEKTGYLPARATIDGDAPGTYDLRGISTTRVDTFHEELGTTYDDATTLVLIEVRHVTSGAAVDGVTIDLGGTDGFHDDADHVWDTGATTAGGRYVVFPNVVAGELVLTVTGGTCDAPAAVVAEAGEVALATVYCE